MMPRQLHTDVPRVCVSETVQFGQDVPAHQLDVIEYFLFGHPGIKETKTHLVESQLPIPCQLLDAIMWAADNEGAVGESVQISGHFAGQLGVRSS